MLDRRTFMGSGVAGFAGVLTYWNPQNPLRPAEPPRNYRPSAFRWNGSGLDAVSFEHAQLGDFVVFADMRHHRPVGDLDLFMIMPAPPGHPDETVLHTLGRYGTMAEVRTAAGAHLQRLARTFDQHGGLR